MPRHVEATLRRSGIEREAVGHVVGHDAAAPSRLPCPPPAAGASASSSGRSHTTTPSRRAREELAERLVHVEPRAVGAVVVELGVREHGDVGMQLQQRAVGLVGLDDDPLPVPQPAFEPVERTSPPTR